MPPCFPLPFYAARRRRRRRRRRRPKLLSFLKPRSLARCHASFDKDDGSATTVAADLNNHQVIILETRKLAMMKGRNSQPPLKELETGRRWHLWKDCKAGDEEDVEKRGEERERVGESEEEFFSVKSSLSRCSGISSEECWWEERGGQRGRSAAGLPEEWFWECKGWPFGLWRQRLKVAVMPPPLKSPSDSWSWHKTNLSNGKVWPVLPASVNFAQGL